MKAIMSSESFAKFCRSTFRVSLCAISKEGRNCLKKVFRLNQTVSGFPSKVSSRPLYFTSTVSSPLSWSLRLVEGRSLGAVCVSVKFYPTLCHARCRLWIISVVNVFWAIRIEGGAALMFLANVFIGLFCS